MRRSNESGFLLVGVVILILALTILGLSLFSLSSYESQFLTHSVDDLQAFQTASGGIERAKYILIRTGQLADVRNNLPPGVDSLIAGQDQGGVFTMNGPVNWDAPTHRVFIRARATSRGSIRTMQAWFDPGKGTDYYRRLATVSDTIDVVHNGGDDGTTGTYPLKHSDVLRWGQDYLSGPVCYGRGNVDWYPHLAGNPTSATPLSAPVPDVGSYITTHADQATPITQGSGPIWNLGTSLNQSTPTFYKSIVPQATPFSIHEPGSATINVKGTVVWMFNKGFFVNDELVIRGDPTDGPDVLILAGQANSDDPNYPMGLWFKGGVSSTNCALVLASDNEVRIEHFQNFDGPNTNVPQLSIYAKSAWILGPIPGAAKLILSHDGAMDNVIDFLNTLDDVLPSQGAKNSLTLVAGSWQEQPIP